MISAEVVTADGQLRKASATEHPDLFWALRGGGGNFGVVTSFEYRLHPVTQVLGGMVLYPLDHAAEMLRFYRDFCPTLPDEAEAYAALLTSPDGVPMAAMLLGYNGPIDEGETVLAPARQFGSRSPIWWRPCRMALVRRCSTPRLPSTVCIATGARPSRSRFPTR